MFIVLAHWILELCSQTHTQIIHDSGCSICLKIDTDLQFLCKGHVLNIIPVACWVFELSCFPTNRHNSLNGVFRLRQIQSMETPQNLEAKLIDDYSTLLYYLHMKDKNCFNKKKTEMKLSFFFSETQKFWLKINLRRKSKKKHR